MNILVAWNLISTRASICGHRTKLKGLITAFDETINMTMPLKNGKPEYCLDCIAKMTIQCAWCGKSIAIGDPITLYIPDNENFNIPEHAVIYGKDPIQLVGCLRWDCADTGGARSGFWMPSKTKKGEGEVMRVMSPIEMALNSDSTIIVGDIGDIREATKYG